MVSIDLKTQAFINLVNDERARLRGGEMYSLYIYDSKKIDYPVEFYNKSGLLTFIYDNKPDIKKIMINPI